MKKVLSVVLCVCMLLSFAACTNEQKPQETTAPEAPKEIWLPYGLEFGMSYDEFCAKLEAAGVTAPSLRPATANDGYVAGLIDVEPTDQTFWSFFASDEINQLVNYATMLDNQQMDQLLEHDKYGVALSFSVAFPSIGFSFNQDRELYEFYLMLDTDPQSEFGQAYLNALQDVYNKKFNVSNTASSWETDEMGVSVKSYDTDFEQIKNISLVLQDKSHDLNS